METKVFCKKVSFSDEKQAQIHIDKLAKTSRRGKIPIRSYKCQKCECFHLTSQIKNEDGKKFLIKIVELESLIKLKDKEIESFKKTIEKRGKVIEQNEKKISVLNLKLKVFNLASGADTKSKHEYNNLIDSLISKSLKEIKEDVQKKEELSRLKNLNDSFLKRIMEQNIIIEELKNK